MSGSVGEDSAREGFRGEDSARDCRFGGVSGRRAFAVWCGPGRHIAANHVFRPDSPGLVDAAI